MAFSATVRGRSFNGPAASTVWGTWTGATGDAAGTLAISGIVTRAIFQKFDALDNTYEIIPRIERSTSSGITTLTIENQDTVTDGFFTIEVLG